MRDSNGKQFKVGDDFHTFKFGMCKVLSISDDGESMTARTLKENAGTIKTLEYTQAQFDDIHSESMIVRTWKDLAADALNVSHASNLSGVAISFARVVIEVRRRLAFEGIESTDAINAHPVCVIYAQAISNLTGCESMRTFGMALDWAKKQTDGGMS